MAVSPNHFQSRNRSAGRESRRYFRPALECLERRVVPAGHKGDLVLGPTDQLDVSLTRRHLHPRDRLQVRGSVAIDGATLNVVSLGERTRPGDDFVIIANDGRDPVRGTFAGLPEGATLTAPGGGKLRISYKGGPGDNDVVLTRVNVPPTFINRSVTSLVAEGQAVTLTGNIVDPDPWDIFVLNVNWGDGVVQTYSYPPGSAGKTVSVTHKYVDDAQQYVVRFSWSDKTDFGNSAELFTQVTNVAPVVEAADGVICTKCGLVVSAGSTLRHTATFTDPGADRWTAKVDWGDGTPVQTLELDKTGKFLLEHLYRRPGVSDVVVNVMDDDGGIGSYTFQVTVV
jgi:hypothetical protein